MQWAAVVAGAPRGPLTESFNYCDLGCGDGTTLSLLAACYPKAHFVGIDLNEAHVTRGRERAARSGLGNLSFVQSDFAGLDDHDLPEFDYIAAYGVYSWLSAGLRHAIDSFAARKLCPGGLFGVHYSSLPGSTIRDALNFQIKTIALSSAGDSRERLARGIDAVRRLAPASAFFAQNPEAGAMLRSLDSYDAGSVAHDILNREPHSFYFAEVHGRLKALGMDFLGSANVLPDYPDLLLPGPAFTIYRDTVAHSDSPFREAIRDLMLNTPARFDLYTKPAGPRGPLAGSGRSLDRLGDLFVQRASSGRDIEARRRRSAACAVDLTSNVYNALLDLSSASAITLGDLLQSRALAGFPAAEVDGAIERLFALGLLNVLVQRPVDAAYRSDRRYRLRPALNALRLEETLPSNAPEGFASTVLGSPLLIPPMARLQLLAALGGDLDRAWQASGGAARGPLEQFRNQIRASLPRFLNDDLSQLLRLGIIEEDR